MEGIEITRNPLRTEQTTPADAGVGTDWASESFRTKSALPRQARSWHALPPEDLPAAFSTWSLPERQALVDRLQQTFDRASALEPRAPTTVLRSAAGSYLRLREELAANPRDHTGNQLMPGQTKAHQHALAKLAILLEALNCGCCFRWLASPVTIRGSRAVYTKGPDREEFGTLVQAAPASARGYFQHR